MSEDFTAQRVTRSGSLTLHAPPEQVFPLFGPVREAEWSEGWDPTIVYAENDLADEEGAVFATQHPGETVTTWVIARYEPEAHHIEYARVTPGSTAVRILIHCEAAPSGATTAHVTYQITTLAEAGDHMLKTFNEPYYQRMMSHWETAINHLLSTGTRLAGHH